MRFIKQHLTISVRNLDDAKREECRHSKLLPNTIRVLVCGPSNCGKTNSVLGLLISPHGLRFEHVYVYSKSLHQPKYRFLKNVFEELSDIINYYTYTNNADVVPVKESMQNSIFIFDDIACDKQSIIRDYFSMGRHSQIDCFYLCQTYAKIPKHLIRDNANFIILFNQDSTNLRHIFNEHVNSDMPYNKFLDLCSACWQETYGFLVIDKDSKINRGRYRRGFDEFIIL